MIKRLTILLVAILYYLNHSVFMNIKMSIAIAWVTLAMAGGHASAQPAKESSRPPNIVFFLADDLGWTGLGSFGSDYYETPRIDALAASGVKFTQGYAACTVCSPTRASIMTGMYPARLHLTDFIPGQSRPDTPVQIPNWTKALLPEYVTIAEVLQAAGYRTGHIGKWHLNGKDELAPGTMPTEQGFDLSIDSPSGSKGHTLPKDTFSSIGTSDVTDWLTDHACDFIRESKDEPFFLYFAYHVPHTPIQGREDLVAYFRGKLDSHTTHNNPTYAAMVASMDLSVGRVLDQLSMDGIRDNTVVIFTSDNGGLTHKNGKHVGFTENLPLRRGKGSAYEGGVRVPTIVNWPGVTPMASTCDEPVISVDYFPTLVEMAGATEHADTHGQSMDGVSLVPLLKNPRHKMSRSLYWHYPHYHAGGDSPYSAIRSGDFRLIEFHEPIELHQDEPVQLYDLSSDVGETKDLSKEMPEKVDELQRQLHEWYKRVDAQMPIRR